MDDLSEKLSGLLKDPQAMQQLTSMASALGLGESLHTTDAAKNQSPNPLSSLSSLSPDTLSHLSALAPMLSSFSAEDETTRLLKALRPFLKEERRKKLDEAEKIIRIMKLLPLVKDFHLFD